MNYTLKIVISFFTTLILMSCEKEVDFDFLPEDKKVVVEGSIENDEYPIVRLSSTIGFFNSISYEQVANAVIRNAKVFVSDEEREIELKEYEIPIDSFKLYYFAIDPSNPDHISFKGEVGKRYHLRIVHDGKEYTSTTTIPQLNEGIDSIYHEKFDFTIKDSTTEMLRNVVVRYKDPPDERNYVRYFTSLDGNFYEPSSVLSDEIINGATLPVSIYPPINRFDTTSFDQRGFFQLGDTVRFKWSAIDYDTYTFYNTLNFSQNSIGNPFASPVQVTSNMKGGALGIWAGYASKKYVYIIQE